MSPLDYGIDPLLRMKDLLQMMSVSDDTIYRYIRDHKFPKGENITHKVTFYKLSEVRLAIESGFKHDFSEINATR